MSEKHPVGRCMETASGRFFNFDAPEFHVEDIATQLSRLNRYTGACTPYSVAEHCWHVSYLADNAIEGLLHDAPEAYLNDISSPVKRRPELAGFCELEDRIWVAMADHFGLAREISADTHHWDNAISYIEADQLLVSRGRHWPQYAQHQHLLGSRAIRCWSPSVARQAWLQRFRELTAGRQTNTNPAVFQEVFNG